MLSFVGRPAPDLELFLSWIAADQPNAAASAAAVLEEIEHVFEFSARVKAQKRVTEGWIWP